MRRDVSSCVHSSISCLCVALIVSIDIACCFRVSLIVGVPPCPSVSLHNMWTWCEHRRMRRVLSAPTDVTTDMPSKLAFLQALIIELGLYTSMPSLPNSLRAAKALLKSQVFLNVRDYLAVRQQGVEALRGVMHPSRSALLREIRGGKKAPVKAVKDSGLGVLLVTCYR